jgi:hypothetical protein
MGINWDAVRENDEFKALSYDEQKYVLASGFVQEMSQNQDFLNANDTTRTAAIDQFTKMHMPAFETSDDEVTQELMALALQAQETGNFDELIGRRGREAFASQMSLVGTVENWIQGATSGGREARLAEDRDRAKALAYIDSVLDGDAEVARKATRAKIFGNIGGFIADFASLWALSAPLAAGVRTLAGATKLGKALGVGSKAFTGSGRLLNSSAKRWFVQTLVPEIGRNIRGGLIGVARENILESFDGVVEKDPTLYHGLLKNLETFGEYFIGDMLFFSGWEAGKIIAGAAKGVFGKGFMKAVAKGDEIVDIAAERKRIMDLALGDGLSNEQIRALPKSLQQKYARLRARAATFRNVDQIQPGSWEMFEYMAYGKGFDVEQVGNKFKVRDLVDDKIYTTDNPYKTVDGLLAKRNAKSYGGQALNQAVEATDEIKIKNSIQGRIKKGALSAEAAQNLVNTADGTVSGKDVRFAVRETARRYGVDPDAFSITLVDDVAGKVVADGVVSVPKGSLTPAKQREYIEKLFTELDDRILALGGTIDDTARATKASITKTIVRGGYSNAWLDYASKTYLDDSLVKFGAQGDVAVTRGQDVLNFASKEEYGQWLFKEKVLPSLGEDADGAIRASMKEELGVTVELLDDARYQYKQMNPEGKIFTSRIFNTLDEVMAEFPKFTPKLPVSAAPKITVIDDVARVIRVENGVFLGPTSAVADLMGNFKDYKRSARTKTIADGVKIDSITRTFEAINPETGAKKTFETMAKARAWAKQTVKNLSDLNEMAFAKGARITPTNGKLAIYQKGFAEPIVVDSLQKAKAKVKALQQPEYVGKELSGLDPGLIEGLEKEFAELTAQSPFEASIQEVTNEIERLGKRGVKGDSRVLSGTTAISSYIAPTDIVMKRISRDLGDPAYYKAFKEMNEAQLRMRGAESSAKNEIKRMFKGVKGKDREFLGEVFMNFPEDQWAKGMQEVAGRAITSQESNALTSLRTYLGRTPDQGLSASLGIDSYKFLNDYFPRIRDTLAGSRGNWDSLAKDALHTSWGMKTLPKEIDFFAKHMRTDDLARYALKKDIVEVMDTYVSQGYREAIMGQPYEQIIEVAKRTKDMTAKGRLQIYAEQIMGINTTEVQKAVDSGVQKLLEEAFDTLRKKGLTTKEVPASLRKDLVTLFSQFTVGATMSYRPWLPIRNSFQPFLTLAPRVGNDVVVEAMKRAAKNGDEIVPRLKAEGIIPDKAPLLEMYRDNFQFKFNEIGMKAYQNSDAWTRAVVDQSVDLLMEDASKRYLKGWLTEKQFLEMSKLNTMGPEIRKEVLEALSDGGYARAKKIFRDNLTDETMFPYRPGTQPAAFKGAVGRLFGQFGHYPVYYTTNILRGLSKSKWQSAAFATRAVGNSLALYHVFTKVLGVDAKNFIYSAGIGFDGGPYYHLMNTALQAASGVGTGDYTQKQAAGKIFADMKNLFIPGSSMARSAAKSIDALQKGDLHGFIVNGLGAPVYKDY